ncbi:probable kynureninase [Cyanidioschyzon merolae strain 10D]|jgi:kynureninase|uniref:Kynureninase n=1 Tax=Cyanidioschyzon merolae (strain NIES-3377 / 10D) TaxID=280699 RepID=M1UPV3_CYAM1|nr:probable kynureninase [Cyanidioschyzon merolae strain 10D]BAM79496.1 probable kynureninase [Cyanidioschyzon merolae strain 10D]|eukprot:XP_005535782.1 probable kynureninase [Cyanidioschyzon merolae strain 10D]
MHASVLQQLFAATRESCKTVAELVDEKGAESLDENDVLAVFRQEFYCPGRGPTGTLSSSCPSLELASDAPKNHLRGGICDQHDEKAAVYLCGHSLGLLPKRAYRLVSEHLELWARLGVRGHFEGPDPWYTFDERPLNVGGAEIVGALPHEVVYMNSLTVNLHLMMIAFYRPTAKRHRILIEKHSFPSDRCVVLSQVAYHGYDPATAILEVGAGSEDAGLIDLNQLESVLNEYSDEIALVLLPGVQYLTGQLLPMEELVNIVRKTSKDIKIGFDLAHAVGNVVLKLHEWAPDFACWCCYKYMNGGPGAVAGCFVNEKHTCATDLERLPRLCGWWGLERSCRFETPRALSLPSGAKSFQLSNPPILALAPVVASLEIFRMAGGMQAIRQKSVLLTGYLELLLEQLVKEKVLIITPQDPNSRGCQLSLKLNCSATAKELCERLANEGFICDAREPNILRVAPVPLYNSFSDVHSFVRALVRLTSIP